AHPPRTRLSGSSTLQYLSSPRTARPDGRETPPALPRVSDTSADLHSPSPSLNIIQPPSKRQPQTERLRNIMESRRTSRFFRAKRSNQASNLNEHQQPPESHAKPPPRRARRLSRQNPQQDHRHLHPSAGDERRSVAVGDRRIPPLPR